MRFPLRPTSVTRQRLLAVSALIGQLFGAIGVIPIRANFTTNHSSVPYPCQNHYCGCLTAEACWAGPCCCFTMREKVAWATERGIKPPDDALRLADEEGPPTDTVCSACQKNLTPQKRVLTTHKSSCEESQTPSSSKPQQSRETPSQSPTWVIGIFAKKCRGEGPGGLLKLDPSVTPASPSQRLFAPILLDSIAILWHSVTSNTTSPPTPPPRQS